MSVAIQEVFSSQSELSQDVPPDMRGTWLQLTIFNSGAPAHACVRSVVVPKAGAEWQALSATYPLLSGTNKLYFFAGKNVSRLVLEPTSELSIQLQWRKLCPAPSPPPNVAAPICCRTLSHLTELGVVHLCDLILTDELRWPLRAIGVDPQLRFVPPRDGVGTYRLKIQMEVESGIANPTVYRNERRGFSAKTALGLTRVDDSTWLCDVHFGRRCVAWRLDPTDRPGRLNLKWVEFQKQRTLAERVSGWPTYLAKFVARWVRTASGVWTEDDLRPAHQLKVVDEGSCYYLSTGSDPYMRLQGVLRPGWYILETCLDLPTTCADARVYADMGEGESENSAFGMPLRSGRPTRRLLHLPKFARLRFDPMSVSGALVLRHFRLERIPEAAACSEMQGELRASHPSYRTQSVGFGDLAAPAATPLPIGAEDLWAQYAGLFDQGGTIGASYADWIDLVEKTVIPSPEQQQVQFNEWAWRPTFSVVVPVHNTPERLLRACLDSVISQTYPHWELCVADDASSALHVRSVLTEYASRDARVRVAWREKNGHIAAASNSALELATGDFIALLDHDDVLPPYALFFIAEALQRRPTAQLIYSDEDKLSPHGFRCDPFFKPAWSRDLLYSQNYFSHLGVYRRDLVEKIGGFRSGFDGSQDYDLVLRCVALVHEPEDIVHVPRVLYHWRMTEGSTARCQGNKEYASEAGRRALQEYFDVCHPGVRVSATAAGIYRHRWPLPASAPLVSLIIPTRDGIDVLRPCIESIVGLTAYTNYEILLVDNGSTCDRTLAYMNALQAGGEGRGRVRVLRYDKPFNFSGINNFAASHARGAVLGLINNDIEVIGSDWLEEMVSHAMRPDVGCVGAKLYYPDDTVQHGGVVLGLGGVANHAFRRAPRNSPGYFGRLWTIYNPSAVTGAVLLLRRDVFDAVGGLDAMRLPVAFNDVDLCLKVKSIGYRNVWTPHAEFYHHESITRGADDTAEKRARFIKEVTVMLERWASMLRVDPGYNPNLTRANDGYSLALVEPEPLSIEVLRRMSA